MKRSDDPAVIQVAEIILGFDWHDYGMDELDLIDPEAADYAWALADEIVTAQRGVS